MTQEWSNHHPSLSILKSKELSHSKMKWWAIYTNSTGNAIVRQPHPRGGDSQGQKMFLAPSGDKQTRNYDTRELKPPSLSTLRSKGLSHSKMKWWAIYTDLPVNVIDYPILRPEIARASIYIMYIYIICTLCIWCITYI